MEASRLDSGLDIKLCRSFLTSAMNAPKFAGTGKTVKVSVAIADDDHLDDDEFDLSLTQKCNRCKETKTLDQFYGDKNRLLGRSPECICCKKIREKASYQANKEKFSERSKKWRAENYDRYIATQKKWREANPEKIAASAEAQKIKRANKKLLAEAQS